MLHEVVGADVGFVVSDPVSGATICASGRVADFYAAEPRRQVVPLAVIPAKRTGLPACTPDLLRPGLAVRWHARDVLGNYAPAEAQAVVVGG
ncbi:MAG: hypothetical protein VX463_19475 [Pseudomonadota bacterium]|nr:hypothetical protein [Pseudomonadota bacterium]